VSGPGPTGFLVVDKPPGLTSHDVVSIVRALARTRRVGHTGTLDPFATGVLPIALGGATRLIQHLDERHKVYVATVELGAATETGDDTGPVCEERPVPALEAGALDTAFGGLTGALMQKPHRYSAVKVAGRRLYEYARAGEHVDVPARPIEVHGWELLALEERRLRVRVRCSRGTYVRVLAEDLGRALGTCAHLSALRREQSGPFDLARAVDLPTLSRIAAGREDWPAVLRPERGAPRVTWRDRDAVAAEVRALVRPALSGMDGRPRVALSDDALPKVRNGGRPPGPPAGLPAGEPYVLVHGGALVAVAAETEKGPRLLRVMPWAE
jgi:tRNA pseudouridine55 synthase